MKKILEFLKCLIPDKNQYQFLGVLPENNSANVYEFEEVVAQANAPIWTEKSLDRIRTFLSQYQHSSSACVAFSIAKISQILFYLKTQRKVKFSPGWIYKQRSPKVLGMAIDNAISIAGRGLPTEELYPSENLTEEQINNLPDVPYGDGIAKEFAISTNWINVPLDFDKVSSTIQATDKGIMMWFDFGSGEWFGKGIPVIVGNKKPYTHSVVATDVIRYKGADYIVIEDSADKLIGEYGHRKLISREFFKRCWLARYPLTFKFDAYTQAKPKYEGSVKSLQDCLKYDGSLASNVPSTGYYGNLTTEAVKRFQLKNNIQQTGNVGPVTKKLLLEKFN